MADAQFDLTQKDIEELKIRAGATNVSAVDNGRTRLRVSEDKMKVWIYLTKPIGEETYQVSDIVNLLQANGITAGHVYARIKALVKKGVYDREIVVARGSEVEEGTDGYYEYFFDTEAGNGKPRIREDGSVDYTAMSAVANIKKGDKIATYHPPVPGKDGFLVDGTVSKAAIVKELPPLRGTAVIHTDNDYFANETGKIQLNEHNIDIRNVHEISGDVDYNNGRIEFWGDITINGNVSAGAIIRSGRNLIINGVVEAATLFAAGDIILKRGVQGNNMAKIKSRGQIMANFLENCTVEADGDVVANYILNSNVSSKNMVKVSGKRGSIIGGHVNALMGVTSQNIGNETEVKTVIHGGFSRDVYESWMKLRAEETEVQVELQDVLAEMEVLLKRRRLQGATSTKNLIILNKKQKELFARKDQLERDIAECKEQLEKGKGIRVTCEGTVYRGTIIELENYSKIINEDIAFVQYKIHNGEVTGFACN